MNKTESRLFPGLCCAASIVLFTSSIASAQGFGLSITDTCGNSLSGTGSSTSVDANGNVSIPAISTTYAVLGCETPAPTVPACSLSASQTIVGTGTPVTLIAKCNPAPTGWSWVAPANAPSAPSGQSATQTFSTPGAYTYAVTGTNGNGSGAMSSPVTILVAGAGSPPTCVLTLSPVMPQINAPTQLQAVCNPTPSSYVWTADAGAPAAPSSTSSGGQISSSTPGTFTYKVQGSNGSTSGPVASATVTFGAALFATAAFNPPGIGNSDTSTLTVTISNSASAAANGVAFSMTMPTNISLVTTSGATTCAGATVTASNYSPVTFALSGTTVPAGGSCTASISVVAGNSGVYSFSTGTISSSNEATAAAAGATLTVASKIYPTMAFNPAYVALNTPATLTIVLNNNGATPVTGIAFTNTYPAGLVNASPASASTTCSGGTVAAADGGTSVSLSGAQLAGSSTCQVTVSVLSATSATYTDTIPVGAITTANAGSSTFSGSALIAIGVCPSVQTGTAPAVGTTSSPYTMNPTNAALALKFQQPASTQANVSGIESFNVAAASGLTAASNVVVSISTTAGDFSGPLGVCMASGHLPITLHSSLSNTGTTCGPLLAYHSYYLNIQQVSAPGGCVPTCPAGSTCGFTVNN